LQTAVSKLEPGGGSITVTVTVSNGDNGGVTSSEGYFSLSHAKSLELTGFEQVSGDDDVSVTNYSADEDDINYKDGSLEPATHPLTDVREQYDPGETNTYNLTIERVSAEEAWIAYRAAFEPLIHDDSTERDTFVRYPTAELVDDTDQQNFAAFNISTADSDSTDRAPVARIAASATTVTAGDSLALDGSPASDDNGISSWTWDGDTISQQSGKELTATFDSAGRYTVSLTVADAADQTDTTSVNVTVTPGHELTATFESNRSVIEQGNATRLRATVDADTYAWDLDGNGVYDDGSGNSTTWTPSSSGEFAVGLRVTRDGDQDTVVYTYSVSSAEQQLTEPSPVLDAPTTLEVGETGTFDASGSTDRAISGDELVSGRIESYEWDFDGDGKVDTTGASVERSFGTAGSYTVNLTVRDDDGYTASVQRSISVVVDEPDGGRTGFVDVDPSDLPGAGTSSDPYLITNASELQTIGDDLDATYALVSDIDASDTVRWNGGEGFTPIGENPATGDAFTGTVDGRGHNITGLTVTRPNEKRIGLFSAVSGAGTVKTVSLVGVNITGGDRVGGLIGENAGGTIRDSSVSGQIEGSYIVGALVAENEAGTVSDSYANGTVSGDTRVGGLVGRVLGTVSGSYATGNVSGTDMIGGLVGENHNFATVTESYATGTVTGSGETGGLIGRNVGSVSKSIALGAVTGENSVGGLVGRNGYSESVPDQQGSVKRSYARGSVTATTDNGGGLVGQNDAGDITQTYAIGRVSGSGALGGLVGDNGGTVVDSYWDTESSGLAVSAGGTGLTAADMTGAAARDTMTGFDFSETWQTRTEDAPTFGWYLNTPPTADAGSNRSIALNNTVTINGTLSTDDGEITQYQWDVDDDGTFERSGPTQTFSFTRPGKRLIRLKVVDEYGQTSADTVTITVGDDDTPPIANATANSIGYRTVRLSGAQSSDNGIIASYEWDTDNDGSYEETGRTSTVTYERPGIKTVAVRVTDTSGNSDRAVTNITVANSPPTVQFGSDKRVFGGQSVRLNSTVSDPDEDRLTYSWTVINGSGTVSGSGSSSVYAAPSGLSRNTSASVQLTVSDGAASASATVRLTVVRDAPSAVVTRSSWRVQTNTSVRFDASRSRDLDGTISSYAWDFDGDGVTDATGVQPRHTFTTAGYQMVSLTVTDDDNKSTTAHTPIHVSRPSAWHSWGDNPANTGTNTGSGVAQPVSQSWITATASGASAPVVVNGSVYVTDGNGTVHALDATTGTAQWTHATGNESLSSPAVANGTVYVGSRNDTVYAFDASTGAVRWTAAGSGPTFVDERDRFTRPVVTGDTVIVASHTLEEGSSYSNENGRVYAFDAETGAERWNEPLEVSGTVRSGEVSAPAVDNGTVYVSQLIWMHAFDADSGVNEWTTSTGDRSSLSTPVVSNGTLYAGSSGGTGYAFDGATGSIRWRADNGVGDSPPAVVDNAVLFASPSGSITAVETETGSVSWQSSMGTEPSSSPTVVDDTVYSVGTDGTVSALELRTGETEWTEATAVQSGTRPAVVNERLYVGGSDGRVSAVGGQTAALSVSIDSTNGPVTAGQTIEIRVAVTNKKKNRMTQSIRLMDKSSSVDSAQLTLTPGETETAPLTVSTTTDDVGQQTFGVAFGDNTANATQVTVTVRESQWCDRGSVTPNEPDIDAGDLCGDGTERDPYLVATLSELQAMEDDPDGYFLLTQNIDATATSEWNDGQGFTPVGSFDGEAFSGTLDGAGYNITNLVINRPTSNYVGLIGYASGAQVQNVSVTNISVTGDRQVGGLVGRARDGTNLTHTRVAGTVSGVNTVGGVVGWYGSGTSVTDGSVSTTVNGTRNVGGLVGRLSRGTISESTATGAVNGSDTVGGLVGDLRDGGTVSEASANSSVQTAEGNAGGLVGKITDGTVSRSFATGSVNGTRRVGGVVGENEGTVTQTYARGPVTGDQYAGGLVGLNQDLISQSYATGTVTGDGGGLVGAGRAPVKDSYWDEEATRQTDSSGGTGLKTAQMSGSSARKNMTGLAFGDIWRTQRGEYPALTWQSRDAPSGNDSRENIAPTAAFTYTPTTPTTGTPVTFDASNATDPDGRISSYEWDVDAGASTDLSGETATHTYSVTGSYQVSLTVIDNGGATDTITRTVSVPSVTVSISGPSTITAGRTGSYTFTVENTGESPTALRLTLDTDTPYNETVVGRDDDGGTYDSDTRSWLWETVAAGGNKTPSMTVEIPSDATPGTYTLTATLTTGDETVTVTNKTVTVQPPAEPAAPEVVGDSAAQDPDGDAIFEDVNGDGTVNIVDVNALFQNRQAEAVQKNGGLFDINDDGAFNIVDVNRLFQDSRG
jgi:outer membrane protein assembly factor BamB